jgi:uncharacterized protein YbjQ (UPF0145 family)
MAAEYLSCCCFLFIFMVVPLLVFIIPMIIGIITERRHLEELSRRELSIRDKVIFHNRKRPLMKDPKRVAIVSGSVTIGVDTFKTWLAKWRQVFGGRMGSLLPVLERARREALLRALEQAQKGGFTEVGNLRIAFINIGGSYNPKQKTLMTSVLVYGTAYSDK